MSRNKDGCSIFSIAAFVIFSIIFAIDGKPESLYFVLGIFTVLLLIVGIGKLFSTETNETTSVLSVLSNIQATTEHKIHEKKLTGKLCTSIIPSDIQELSDLEYVGLKTKYPLDISHLINSNHNLHRFHLEGPFSFQNLSLPSDQIHDIAIINNPNILNILGLLRNQTSLYGLKIISNVSLEANDFMFLTKNLKNLTLHCKLRKFPYQVLNSENLSFLNLDSNKISSISDKSLLKNKSTKLNLTYLSICSNRLKKIPDSLLNIETLETINVRDNPITKRNLRKIVKYYRDKVKIGVEQEKKLNQKISPATWVFIKIIGSIVFILMPYLVFDSWATSIIFFSFVVMAWTTK